MTSEFMKGIDHLVRRTKDVNFQVADKNDMFDSMYKETFMGVQITYGDVWEYVESCNFVEDDMIVNYALLYSILDGIDKVENGDSTEVNGI